MKDDYQYRQAVELLKIGMQHGAIKLIGTGNAVTALDNAKADAAYVTAFLTHLSSVLPAEDSAYQ